MIKTIQSLCLLLGAVYIGFLGLKNIYFYNKVLLESHVLEKKLSEAKQSNRLYKQRLYSLKHQNVVWETMARKTFQFILPGEILYKIVYTDNIEKE